MTICEQCGTPAQHGESFCGVCGAYLEWQESTPDQAELTAPAAHPAAAAAEGAGQSRATVAEVFAAGPTAPWSAATRTPASDSPAARAGEGGESVPAAEPGQPPPPAEPAPERAAPVRPGAAAPRPRRRELPAEDRRPLPGETICPACGAGNVPTRRFCRRCGADLVDAPVVPELPWYRRLFRRAPRPARAAGTRPTKRRRGRGLGRRSAIIVLLGLLLAGGWFARSTALGALDYVRDRLSTTSVRATAFAASSEARGHPAQAVNDNVPNRFWSPKPTGAAKGEFVTMGLEAPVRLAYVKVFNGPSSEPGEAYVATARLRAVQLTMTRTDGSSETRTIQLDDSPGGQDFHVGVSDVVSVRVTVLGAYAAGPGRRVALGEVELFRRS